jgi:hypothetical protein
MLPELYSMSLLSIMMFQELVDSVNAQMINPLQSSQVFLHTPFYYQACL